MYFFPQCRHLNIPHESPVKVFHCLERNLSLIADDNHRLTPTASLVCTLYEKGDIISGNITH